MKRKERKKEKEERKKKRKEKKIGVSFRERHYKIRVKCVEGRLGGNTVRKMSLGLIIWLQKNRVHIYSKAWEINRYL